MLERLQECLVRQAPICSEGTVFGEQEVRKGMLAMCEHHTSCVRRRRSQLQDAFVLGVFEHEYVCCDMECMCVGVGVLHKGYLRLYDV